MEIDDKIVKRAAALSGIEIEEEKTEAMVEFFRELVGHFQGLERCDIEGMDPFFDLDGTISHRDTLLPYVARYLLHHPWRLWRLAGVLPPLLGLVTGRADRGALKGELIHAVLGGITAAEVEAWNARSLPHLLERGLFSAARAAIDAHRRHGDHLVLMSASVDLYVPELGRQLGFDATICSGVLWHAGRLDGANRLDRAR